MLMSEVLAKKGDNVFKILSSKTVMDAIIGMTSFKVGAVLVVDDSDKMVGIFTERDVTRILAAHGATVVEAPVAFPVPTAREAWSRMAVTPAAQRPSRNAPFPARSIAGHSDWAIREPVPKWTSVWRCTGSMPTTTSFGRSTCSPT